MTPSELREITGRAKIAQREQAQEYLEMTGYQLMKKAAEHGCTVAFLENYPELITLLEEQGFRAKLVEHVGKVYVSWMEDLS